MAYFVVFSLSPMQIYPQPAWAPPFLLVQNRAISCSLNIIYTWTGQNDKKFLRRPINQSIKTFFIGNLCPLASKIGLH